MNTRPEIALRSITVSLKRANVAELPAAFTAKLALIARVDVANFPPYDASRLTSAVAAALIANVSPATDSAVVAAFAEDQLAHARKWDLALQDWRDGETARLMREWTPALIAEWSGHVAAAGKKLSAAATHLNLGSSLDGQSQAVLRVGGKAASAWHDAYRAAEVIDNAVDAQSILIAFCESRSHADKALLAVPSMTREEYANLPRDPQSGQGGPMADAWTLATLGYAIVGVDYEGYQDARARHNRDIQAAVEAEQRNQEKLRMASVRNR